MNGFNYNYNSSSIQNQNFCAESAEEYVSNPINTYMLLKRTGLHWRMARDIVFNETAEREFGNIGKAIEMLPTSQDLQVGWASLGRKITRLYVGTSSSTPRPVVT